MRFLTAIFIAVMLWRPPIVPDVRIGTEIIFIWGVMIVWAYCIGKINLWMGFFVVLVTFSTYYPINTSASEEAHRLIIIGSIWYYAVYKYGDESMLLDAICVIAVLNCAMLVSQYFGYDPIYAPVKPAFTSIKFDPTPKVGLMDCPNSASALLAFSFPAFLRISKFRSKNIHWYFCLPLIVVGLMISKTFGGVLAVVLSMGFMFFVYVKKLKYRIMFILMLTVCAVGYIKIDRPDTSWRYKTWKYAVEVLIPQKPIMGGGVGHWKILFTRPDIVEEIIGKGSKIPQVMAQGHNDPLQGIMEMGLVFGIILVGYILTIFIKSLKFLNDHVLVICLSAFLAIIIDSNVFFPFHIPVLAMFCLTYMAMLQKRINRCSKEYS